MNLKRKYVDPNIARKGQILEEHLVRRKGKFGVPPISLIEFNLTGLCNRRCPFCPRADPKAYPNINKHISLSLYKKIMTDLREIGFDGTILYSAFGEPLLYKGIERLIEFSKEYCPSSRVEIVCNGDFVTDEKLRQLFNAGLATICISMYDGSHQLEYFRPMQKEVGLTDQQFVLRERYLSREEHYGITLSNRAGMITMADIGIVPMDAPLGQRCHYPFYQFVVDYDGSVLLCPHDWGKKLIAGNLVQQSVQDVWNNQIMRRARVKLANENRNFPPCDTCDVDGTRMGQNHFDQWQEYYMRQKTEEVDVS